MPQEWRGKGVRGIVKGDAHQTALARWCSMSAVRMRLVETYSASKWGDIQLIPMRRRATEIGG